MRNEINALDGNYVPKECFCRLLSECADLYRFRETVKLFAELKEKEGEDESEEDEAKKV
jgi:hypothetical protein